MQIIGKRFFKKVCNENVIITVTGFEPEGDMYETSCYVGKAQHILIDNNGKFETYITDFCHDAESFMRSIVQLNTVLIEN